MTRLEHRGPDGRDVFHCDRIILGHWHFWTTPEETGERQPLALDGLPFHIVFDGRLDNRADLLTSLGMKTAEETSISDAALVLRAYARWGTDCLPHFIGEFAFAIFDPQRMELFCARDALGDRTLFYAHQGTRFVMASEPWAIVGAGLPLPEINETAVAHYFALKATQDGQTFFKGVYELLPAHGMLVNENGVRQWRYWKPDPSQRAHGRSDAQLAEEFRALLEQSIRCRLRSATPVGVLLSGGLDSGTIACLAAQMPAPQPLTAISYVFDELKNCDEREYIEKIISRYRIRWLQLPCDDAWPWKDWDHWPPSPNLPEMNLYRLLKERAYHRAHQEGLRVLMPGAFGDELYSGEEDWLADLVQDKRWAEAGRELKRHIQYAGWRRTLKSSYLRRAGRRLLDQFPMLRRLRRKRLPSPWLTPYAASLLRDDSHWLDPALDLRNDILGIGASMDSAYENFNASRHALELRHPYRDRRLIEFVLTLPAYQLYNRGFYKYILRAAVKDVLPYQILSRPGSTPLLPLFFRGLGQEKELLEQNLQSSDATWQKYVHPDWLTEQLQILPVTEADGPGALLLWLSISYSSWLQHWRTETDLIR